LAAIAGWRNQFFLCAPIKADAADFYELVKPNAPDRPKVSVWIPVPKRMKLLCPIQTLIVISDFPIEN
jgi:hypothetical protein